MNLQQIKKNEPREWIAGYLLIFWALVRAVSYRPAPIPYRKLETLKSSPGPFMLQDLQEISAPSVSLLLAPLEKFKQAAVVDLFTQECLPGFSNHVSITIAKFNEWKLQVFDHIPTPLEILKWQQAGERCITLLTGFSDLSEGLYDNKDPFKFALHDIEHAYHFFKSKDLQKGQIGFYKTIDKILPKISEKNILADEDFSKDLNYLISDMNSHCVHLTKTLHAILLKSYKGDDFLSYWQSLFENWNLSSEQKQSFHSVNLRHFNDTHARIIEDFFQQI
jgi:hypothetical protein